MEYVEHWPYPLQHGRSDFLRRHHQCGQARPCKDAVPVNAYGHTRSSTAVEDRKGNRRQPRGRLSCSLERHPRTQEPVALLQGMALFHWSEIIKELMAEQGPVHGRINGSMYLITRSLSMAGTTLSENQKAGRPEVRSLRTACGGKIEHRHRQPHEKSDILT